MLSELETSGLPLRLVFCASSELMELSACAFIRNQPCPALGHFLGRTELPILLHTLLKIYCYLMFPVLVACFANYIGSSFGTGMIYFLACQVKRLDNIWFVDLLIDGLKQLYL